jgi:hypothetical protein
LTTSVAVPNKVTPCGRQRIRQRQHWR